MKEYVWTYWTKPHFNKINFFDLACLALSTCLVKTHGIAKKIYTDKNGFEQINKFCLNVDCEIVLDDIENEQVGKFALPKIITYSKINFNCIHIDYDVFLFKEQKETDSDFIVQSLENFIDGAHYEIYKRTYNTFIKNAGYIPKEIEYFALNNIFAGYNMGYVDIKNIAFLNCYALKARKLFNDLSFVTETYDNCLIEQCLFYCMTQQNNISVDILLDNNSDWNQQAIDLSYTHLMEDKIKKRKQCFEVVLKKLSHYNLDIYKKIISNIM